MRNRKQELKNKKLNKNGFTLVEILAVVVILGILLLIAVPAINQQLANFRLQYYKKLEASIKVTGEDYMSDHRYSRPTKLLYSKVIKVKDLEDEKYIEEVEDYLGNKCDNSDTSYSYVVVVKTGDKTYEYTTCLKCSEDEYATDTTGEKNDYCNVAWMGNENIYYTDPTFNSDILFIYAGTPEQKIRELLAFEYGIEKRDANGNVLAVIPSNGDKLYPKDISKLVSASLNEPVTLLYELPDGTTMEKQAMLYKHYAPEVSITYTNGNSTKGLSVGQKYNSGPNEWANKLTIRLEFSDKDHKLVVENLNIKTIEYYDSNTKTWKDTGCTVSKNRKSCVWTIATNFNESVKFRVVNDRGEHGDESWSYSIKVDTDKPTCNPIDDPEYKVWRKRKTVSVGCLDTGGSACSSSNFSISYPTATVYNKKTDEITIMDNAGNKASCPVDVYVDSTPPTPCVITATSEGKKVNNGDTLKKDVDLDIIGRDEEKDASGIKSNEIDVKLNDHSLGHLNTTYDKDNGKYEIVPYCYDNAGNLTVGESLNFTLDKEVRITYLGNTNTGGSMGVQVCKYNQNCTIMNNGFEKTGYHFVNWKNQTSTYNPNDTVKLKSDLILEAQWEPNKYTIHFDGSGNTDGSTKDIVCTYDENCTLTKNGFVKKGYTFVGWMSKGTPYGDMEVVRNLTSVNDGKITMTAVWNVNSYKLTYDSNTGEPCNPGSKVVKYGEQWGDLCRPTKTGYTFVGWYTAVSGGTPVTSDTRVDAQNITVYAHWKANEYTIKFDGNKKTSGEMQNKTCTYDQDCVLPSNQFSRTGYQFGGWTFNSEEYKDRDTVRNLTSDPNGNVTLTAKWIANKYTIDFNGNNNTGGKTDSVICTYDEYCPLTKNGFVRTGYTFVVWSNGNTMYMDGERVHNLTSTNNGHVTLTAVWAANNYTLTYNAKGGTTCNPISKTIVYDSAYGDLCNTSRTGYIFDGWYTEETGGSLVNASTTVKVTNNQTIYAHWTAITYKVAFDGNTYTSGTMTTQTCTYDQYCKLANNGFQKIGYSFANWTFSGKTYKDGDSVWNLSYKKDDTVTLKANWTPNNYKLTFDSNTGNACNPNTLTITYDAPYNKHGSLCNPTKTGYHFLGWYTSASGGEEIKATTTVKVTSDQIVYAHWAPNTHKLTYDTQGGIPCNPSYREVSYDARYGPLCETSKVGYTFEGWYTATTGGDKVTEETIVRGDLTIYAHWRVHHYTIKFNGNNHTSGSTNDVVCTYDQECQLTPNGYNKTGYTFSGWDHSNNHYNNGDKVRNLSAKDNDVLTMNAKWTANTYTIKFNGNGNDSGSTADITCTYDQRCNLPLNGFVKAGHSFAGWLNGDKLYDNGESVINLTPAPNGVIPMIAMWTTNSYTLTYNNNSGNGCSSQSALYGSPWGDLCQPTRTGYTFDGWYTALTNGTKINATDIVRDNVVAYAHWTPITYTINFVGGTNATGSTSSITCTYDRQCTLPGNNFSKTGYTWTSWSYGSQTYGSGATVINLAANNGAQLTFTAVWAANTYVITFAGGGADSGSTPSVTCTYDRSCTLPGNGFGRTGYTWASWSYGNQTYGNGVSVTNLATSGAITMTANWTPNTYYIDFNGNGGSGSIPRKACTYDTGCLLPGNTFTNYGYTFLRWTNGGAIYNDRQTVWNLTPTNGGVVTLSAVWGVIPFTLTYNSNYGSACTPGTKTANYGSAWGELCQPTRAGYTFAGWYDGSNWIYANTTVTGNISVTAQWNPITYYIRFDPNGGSGNTPDVTCTYGSSCTLPGNSFNKYGYYWTGWLYGSVIYTANNSVSNLTTTPGGVVTMFAHWAPNNYTLTYNSDGGSNCITKVAPYGSNWGELCRPTKTGYTFNGWYSNGIKINDYHPIDGDLYLTASWSANTYTLTYDNNGGNGCGTISGPYGSSWGTLCTPSLTGYLFDGWYTAASGGYQVSSGTFMNNSTIYAHWTPITYYIRFDSNGGSGSTPDVTCKYDEYCYLRSNGFYRSGYYWTGWYYGGSIYTASSGFKNLTTTPNGVVIMSATWARSTYTLKYASDSYGSGCSSKSITVNAGSTWGTLCIPTVSMDSLRFDGWYTAPSGGSLVTSSSTANSDLTVYAHYKALTRECDKITCSGPNGGRTECHTDYGLYQNVCSCTNSPNRVTCLLSSGSDAYTHWEVTCSCYYY